MVLSLNELITRKQTQKRNEELLTACEQGDHQKVSVLIKNRSNSKNYINLSAR